MPMSGLMSGLLGFNHIAVTLHNNNNNDNNGNNNINKNNIKVINY